LLMGASTYTASAPASAYKFARVMASCSRSNSADGAAEFDEYLW
jgi:hypothetical protein